MNECCPISREMVNENVVRVTAFFILILSTVFLFAPRTVLIGFLLIDFFIRAFWQQKFSPLRCVSLTVNKALKLTPAMVNAAPKVFAAKIGFFTCLIIFFSSLIPQTQVIGRIFILVLIVCAALESFFKYCVGCKMYSIWMRLLPTKAKV